MPSLETQGNLLTAAAKVFSDKGFAGARVEEIARRARANKAMIYYHFRSKEGLYEAVLVSILGGVHDRLEAVARAEPDPRARLVALYRELAAVFSAEPAFPRLILREMLAGGRHMHARAAQALGRVFQIVRGTVEEGVRQGAFRKVSPLLVHLNAVGMLLVFTASTPFRERMREANPGLAVSRATAEDVLGYLGEVLERTLEVHPSAGTRGKGGRR
jgi:TetR/AcrR family transcriptional regulator